MNETSAHPFRRTTAVGIVASVVTILALVVPGPWASAGEVAGGAEEFITGSGKADARVVRLGPSAANLGLAPSSALALADFLGTQGRAEARAFEFAALEGTVEEDIEGGLHNFPGVPEHLLTETLYPDVKVTNADDDTVKREEHTPYVQEARATDDPFGEAVASIEGFEIPLIVKVSHGTARAFAGVEVRKAADGTERPVRVAGGVVDIERLVLASGEVELRDMRWTVTQITDRNDDPDPEVSGSFRIGSGKVGSFNILGPVSGAQLDSVFSQINAVLSGPGSAPDTGFRVDAPKLEVLRGSARITPLAVRLVNSEVGKLVFGPVLSAAHPVRQQIFDRIVSGGGASAVLVADVALGVFAGSGSLDVELGGAFGTTEGQFFENPFLLDFDVPPVEGETVVQVDSGPGPPASTTLPIAGGSLVFPGGASISGGVPSAVPPGASGLSDVAGTGTELAAGAQPTGAISSSASAAWAVGLMGLGATVAMALTEYRQLRARRKQIPI